VNLPVFIARRLSGKDKENLSGPVSRIAVLTIALGIAVMIISVAVLTGFQSEIRNKVIGFSAHIMIGSFDANQSLEADPVSLDLPLYAELMEMEGVKHIQPFALKAGIIKTEDQLHGVILKGAGSDFNWEFIQKHLISGVIGNFSDSAVSGELIISGKIARKLKLDVGSEVRMYFISGSDAQPRGRKFTVCAVYETGLEEFDEVYVIGDIRHIQKLNNWNSEQVSGFEVFIDDFSKLDVMAEQIYQLTAYDINTETITEAYPQIFDWLRLMDINVVVILLLMIMVSGITIISTLLIMIIERTNMIGVLKALGMENRKIRGMFLYLTTKIVLKGLVWGNLAGLGLIILQDFTRIIPLDEESYYISYVPVSLNLANILMINVLTLLLCLLLVLVPAYVIARITPVKAIRFR